MNSGSAAVGWIKDATGSFEAGLYFLTACALLSGIIAYIAVQPTARTAEQGGLATRRLTHFLTLRTTQGSLAGSLCANSGQSAFQIYGRVLPRAFCRCRFTQSSILRRAAALAPSRDPRNLTTVALSWAALSGK